MQTLARQTKLLQASTAVFDDAGPNTTATPRAALALPVTPQAAAPFLDTTAGKVTVGGGLAAAIVAAILLL